MKRPSILFLTLLLLCLTADFTRGEDYQGDDNVQGDDGAQVDDNAQADDYAQAENNGEGDDNAQEEDNEQEDDNGEGDDNAQQEEDNAQVDDQYMQADDRFQWSNSYGNYDDGNHNDDNHDDAYYENQIQVCSDAVIQVQDIVTYCDSPGTFYYGSGKYRNSKYCQPGDKLRVEVSFYIAYNELIQQSGNYALVDVYADADMATDDGSYVSDTVSIYDNADLCSLSSLKRKSRSQCPYNGYYTLKTHVYWNSDNSAGSFVPTIHVGFKSGLKKNVYDFGGANTDLCRGSTFLTWSNGVRVSYANAIGNFMKSFGILFVTTILMGVLVWFLSKRPKNLREAKAHLREAKSRMMQSKLMSRGPFSKLNFGKQTHRDVSLTVDEEFDFRKIQTAGNRDLMDF
jgi:hypothetical protein